MEEVSRGLRVDRGEGLNAGALHLSEFRKKRRNQQHRLRRTRKWSLVTNERKEDEA